MLSRAEQGTKKETEESKPKRQCLTSWYSMSNNSTTASEKDNSPEKDSIIIHPGTPDGNTEDDMLGIPPPKPKCTLMHNFSEDKYW